MSRFEILCVTMHQNDFSKIKEMNIHSDVVFANQCDRTAYEELEFDGHTAKMISTQTRGVGKNRNLGMLYATADICLFADDDVTYHDDVEARVLAEFDAHPGADVMIFHLDTDDAERQLERYTKTKKCGRFSRMPWGGVRIAFRLDVVKKANVWFTTLFGGGCIFPSGEDSMWLAAAKKAGLTFYVSKETIGTVSFEVSSWYTGRDEKFFYARGVYYAAMRPKLAFMWMRYASFTTRHNCNLTHRAKIRWMKHGIRGYREMLSFAAYKEKYGVQ